MTVSALTANGGTIYPTLDTASWTDQTTTAAGPPSEEDTPAPNVAPAGSSSSLQTLFALTQATSTASATSATATGGSTSPSTDPGDTGSASTSASADPGVDDAYLAYLTVPALHFPAPDED